MTLTQMAKRLGLKSTAALRLLCEAGTLRAEKVGNAWLVTDAEVARYQKEHFGKRGRPRKQKKDGEQ